MFSSLTTHYSTGMPALDARDDFARARRAQLAARAVRRLGGRRRRPNHPRTLPGGATRPVRAARLEAIALAHRRGTGLPPIAVLQGQDGYYVVDGRHRVSVALAAGQLEIDAWVT